ncbi:Oligoxyloglucan reducing end-specific cellobiohydrolase [Fomitiporia mediterranea MF3/22]|uniref:Oligoxyloglucan reducing end-specific cellobiohydrolase n=1 Tax=Fomitiporia mediterranea (strain MF3/22) TaxID=694068 RepID=UPI0004408D3F|nr:Oligoxyloglucan reducing end-specific cellobiohydrolase [Fomitiporia mediterranea MF3/22]EJC97846.1 Oligoxyloglucan reducing end-specific cellobiohydrolase [Fomitiporia mediterranea MF3/22]
MSKYLRLATAAFFAIVLARAAVTSEPYVWENVKIGGGGGFVPGIVFNPSAKGLAFARTDIGGAYRLNADDSWTPLLDFADDTHANYWGTDAIATDPVDPDNLYIAVGLYTNSWDPNNGTILISHDRGDSFTAVPFPFKFGGNMPGRGLGERLVVDPNNNKIIYFGARSGHGLWKSSDAGQTWANVTNFPSVGTYAQDPSDSSGYGSDIMGIAWIAFDKNSATSGGLSRIFVGVANMGSDNVFVSEDSGATWSAVEGQRNDFIPHHGVLSPAEDALYIPYANGIGPWDGTAGYVMKYFISNSSWVDITPAQGIADNSYGYSGLSVDLQKPGTVMLAPFNEWYPDANIMRSTDGGASWTQIFSSGYPPPDYSLAIYPNYNYNVSKAPWITTFMTGNTDTLGWGIQGLAIDPFDSDHWLYGTGLTIYGGHDLRNWDANPRKNVTVASLADGVEETAPQALTAPLSGPKLVSAVGDVGGFVHTDLTEPPPTFTNPIWSGTATGVDHAGANHSNIVRLSGIAGSSSVSVATSTDGGQTWSPYAGSPSISDNIYDGKIAMSANGDTLLWTQATGFSGVRFSKNGSPFTDSNGLPSGSTVQIASDKLNNTVFYAGVGSEFFISVDGGEAFTQKNVLGSSTNTLQIAASPFNAGEIFVSTDRGIWHSTDFGTNFTELAGPTAAWSIAVGKAKEASSPPAFYAAATIEGVSSLFRTDDLGINWAKLPTKDKALLSASNMVLAADPNVYSQIFVGAGGRGIFVGHA